MESALRGSVPDELKVIETLGWWPGEGPRRLSAHLDRAYISCRTFDFAFDRALVEMRLDQIQSIDPLRLRMTWGVDGFEMTISRIQRGPSQWCLAIHQTPLKSDDPWLGVKTTNRKLYDEARAALPRDTDEYLFLNEFGRLSEGTITNLFVEHNGVFLTPAITEGVLPGILRAELISEGHAVEGVVSLEMLDDGRKIYVGNSLRGLIPARMTI
ncbi:MAG: aminotransferase class IV [Pseudomonadota bacterium]